MSYIATNQDMTYWKLRLRVVWAGIYGDIEDVADAKDVLECYEMSLQE